MNILVLDAGTSSMRGTLLTEAAEAFWTIQIPYRPTFGEAGQVEQSPADWLNALREICASAAAEAPVEAIALTAQRSSLIPLGAAGEPLRDAIMWQDTRNEAVCTARKEWNERILALSGAEINTVFSGGKMTWFMENEPELYGRTHKLAVIPDLLIHEMTGDLVTDHTYGSRSLLMDLRTRRWSPELLRIFGITEDKLCRLIPPSSAAGHITDRFSRQTGLRSGIPVITCGGDQQCASLGSGVVGPGKASVNLGTGAYLIAAADTVPQQIPRGVVCNASSMPGKSILEASVLTCGSAVDWFLPEGEYAMIGRALRESPPGASGVLALPFFQGRSAPNWNSAARAGFYGLSLETGRSDILRALLEAILIEVCCRLDQIGIGQTVDTVYLSGGLSRTPEVRQLIADISGATVLHSDDSEATTRGAWMAAAHCLGIVPEWKAAWEMAKPRNLAAYTPDTHLTAFYRRLAAKLETLYRSICTADL